MHKSYFRETGATIPKSNPVAILFMLLIHKDLAGFDDNSARSCRHLIGILDPQNTRILQQLDELKWLIDAMKEHLGELQSWLVSDDFLRELEQNK